MTYFQNIHSLADLKKEYRRLALQHHPDKGGDTAVMQPVVSADILVESFHTP